MAHHRARLSALGLAFALAMASGAAAQTSTTSSSTTMTMQQLQGKNLLWLSATMTTCPSGTTLVKVKTATGEIRKACVSTSNTSSMQSSTTPVQ